LLAKSLGRDGLELLKAKFEKLAAQPPVRSKDGERRMIGYGSSGPLYEDDITVRYHTRMVQSSLTEIADALGDVDGYCGTFSAQERTNPRLPHALPNECWRWGGLTMPWQHWHWPSPIFAKAGSWPDWQRMWIDTLDALGRGEDAQAERWAIFERTLNADYYARISSGYLILMTKRQKSVRSPMSADGKTPSGTGVSHQLARA